MNSPLHKNSVGEFAKGPGQPVWGVLISGNGSTLQALLESDIAPWISVVVSSKDTAYGIKRARRGGVPVEILPAAFKTHSTMPPPEIREKKSQSERWVIEALKRYGVTHVFLAGYMRILSKSFIKAFSPHIYNVHPSLLPQYKGLDALAQAVAASDLKVGVTVHRVTEQLDAGEIIFQKPFDLPEHLLKHEGTGGVLKASEAAYLWLHINERMAIMEAVRKIECDEQT